MNTTIFLKKVLSDRQCSLDVLRTSTSNLDDTHYVDYKLDGLRRTKKYICCIKFITSVPTPAETVVVR